MGTLSFHFLFDLTVLAAVSQMKVPYFGLPSLF